MGLAPKQRARLSIQKEVHSLLWCLSHFPAVSHFPADQRNRARKGDRHRALRFVEILSSFQHGASPRFSLPFSL